MSTLEIEAVDIILAPVGSTFTLKIRAGVAEPNLLSQGRVDLLLLVAFGHKLHLCFSIAGGLKARPGHPLALANILNKALVFVRGRHYPHHCCPKVYICVVKGPV